MNYMISDDFGNFLIAVLILRDHPCHLMWSLFLFLQIIAVVAKLPQDT